MWQALTSVPAVRTGRVAILIDQRTVIPGPRVAEGTELIARALHPEAFPNEDPRVLEQRQGQRLDAPRAAHANGSARRRRC